MTKPSFIRPTFLMLYGFPGSGKTHFAHQLCETLHAAHLHSDRIRYELFEQPRYDNRGNEIINNLMDYMTEEFLKAGMSVIYDADVFRLAQRRRLRDAARKHKAHPLLLWFQIDIESAFSRVAKRDRRKNDDRFTTPLDRTTFEAVISQMQNPGSIEDYVVLSGKHTFKTQQQMAMKKFYDLGLIDMASAEGKIAKPELVNRIPNPLAGRVDPARRNIVIR